MSASEIPAFLTGEIASFKRTGRTPFFTGAEYALTGNERIKAAMMKEMTITRLGAEKRQPSPT